MARPHSGLDGVLLLDKDVGLSSNKALQCVRWMFDHAKAGHTGTLDPLASGLLPICFGEATKFAQVLLDAPKSYEAVLKLGFMSNTGDGEGEILAVAAPTVTNKDLDAVFAGFRGRISQLPPIHSALKLNGRPLYAYARLGVDVERVPRLVEITRLDVIQLREDELSISVSCSKGTYIRVLAQDIGRALGCGAYLKALRRISTAHFNVDSASTLDQLRRMSSEERAAVLAPVDALVQGIPALSLTADQAVRLRRGQSILQNCCPGPGNYRLYGPSGAFLGVGTANAERQIAPRRLISTTSSNYLKTLENNS